MRLLFALLAALAAGPIAGQTFYDWPNANSRANSDPWLIANHDAINHMHPSLLVLNFANGVTPAKARAKVDQLIAALRESSRYHGYERKDAQPFLEYRVEKLVDMTDATPPAEKLDGNSSKYPRVPNWKEGINFQYSRLFTDEFTKLYNIPDPIKRGLRPLSLKQLVDNGVIHEVWFLAYQGKYGAPFESVEVKQAYDSLFKKIPGKSVQAGNGGDDGQPFIGRSLRIVFINVERGPGCAMESLGHSFEGMARCGEIPYLKKYFEEYAGFDLDKKYGLPFDSLYGRRSELEYPDPTTMAYTWNGEKRTVKNYVPIANNVHFMPNGRRDYDLDNPAPIMSTIEHYRMHDGPDGKDKAEPWTPKVLEPYRELAADCMGRWVVYWRQNMPGFGNHSKDDSGHNMRNWWPFLFY